MAKPEKLRIPLDVDRFENVGRLSDDIEGQHVAGEKAFGHLQAMFAELHSGGLPEPCDIWLRLFSIEIDSVTHGLFYEQSDEEPEPGETRGEWVMLQPRDIMFHPPWDSGEYST